MNVRLTFVRLVKSISGRAYLWAILSRAEGWEDSEEARRIATRELDAVADSVSEHFIYQKTEQQILSDRLSRRYDLGMALNESAQRAIEGKKATQERMTALGGGSIELSDRQKAALKAQEEYLARIVNNA